MELFAGYSDDMIALGGCIVAAIVCGSLMCLSHFVGQWRRQADAPSDAQATATVEMHRASAGATTENRNTRENVRKRAA